MNDIEYFEQPLTQGNKTVGKVAIFRGGLTTDNPAPILNDAVSNYVGNIGYNEFIEIYLDNPWVRVVVTGINELDFKPFEK